MNAFHVRAPRAVQADILIAGCSPEVTERISRIVNDHGCRVFVLNAGETVPPRHSQETFHLCICDERLDRATAQTLWNRQSEGTHYLWVQQAASAGTPPFPAECVPHDLSTRDWNHILKFAIARAGHLERVALLEAKLQQSLFQSLICLSGSMQELRRQLYQQSTRDTPVLLQGERGVAFQQSAWTVHHASGRSQAAYLALDAAAISAEAFEQQLFHAPESSSDTTRPSMLEQLDGGTLFIHHVETLARTTQKKLIRFIESPAIPRSDTLTLRYINLRLIVGTSAAPRERAQSPLLQYLAERRDSQQITLPSLRDRAEDLRPLCEQILVEQSSRLGILPPALDESAIELIGTHSWPGNEDELARVLTNLVHASRRETITASDLTNWLSADVDESNSVPGLSLAEMERQLIEATFTRCAGNREKTAQLLGIGLRTLSGKLRQYGYPPRGGPGSNRAVRVAASEPQMQDRRAA